MRLIDADAIEITKTYYWEDYIEVKDVMNAPTIDAIEVVRCKECKHRFTENCPRFFTSESYHSYDVDTTEENGFCEKGKRKDD